MKCIASLLAIYLMALLSVPCSDAHTIHSIYDPSAKEIKNLHNQAKTDSCSPLCQCACCSISATPLKPTLTALTILAQEFNSSKVTLQDVLFVSSYTGSIWQPPRFNT